MKHNTKYLIYYSVLLAIVLGGSIALAYKLNSVIPSVALILIVLFIPSVIQGFFWHELFLGRRYLEKGQWKEAAQSFQSFMSKLEKNPLLKKLVWLRWARFTGDVKSMTLSNLGVAELNMGEVESARERFHEASENDPEYPVAYFNLAVCAMLQNRNTEAKTYLQKAQNLGYRKSDYSQLQHIADTLSERLKHDKNKKQV